MALKDSYKHIYCRICNRKYKFISTTHLKKHGVTKDEYINLGHPVVSKYARETYKKISEDNREINREKHLGNNYGKGPHDWSNTDTSNMGGRVNTVEEIKEFNRRMQLPRVIEKRTRKIKRWWASRTPEEIKRHTKKSLKNAGISYQCGDVVYKFRSSWELKFAKFLLRNNIKFEYETLYFNYINDSRPSKSQSVLDSTYNFIFVTEDDLENLTLWEAKFLTEYANQQVSQSNGDNSRLETSETTG